MENEAKVSEINREMHISAAGAAKIISAIYSPRQFCLLWFLYLGNIGSQGDQNVRKIINPFLEE